VQSFTGQMSHKHTRASTSFAFIVCLCFNGHFSRWTWVSWYQNVFILYFVGAKGDGGDNWSYETCKAPVKSLPPTNQHPVFLQAGCPSCHPTNSLKAAKGNFSAFTMTPKGEGASLPFSSALTTVPK